MRVINSMFQSPKENLELQTPGSKSPPVPFPRAQIPHGHNAWGKKTTTITYPSRFSSVGQTVFNGNRQGALQEVHPSWVNLPVVSWESTRQFKEFHTFPGPSNHPTGDTIPPSWRQRLDRCRGCPPRPGSSAPRAAKQ